MGTEVNKQKGAALVIVMVLLASALVMALIGMQAALVDERLAGNFRASIQAQMRAETAALILAIAAARSITSRPAI